LRGAGKDLGEYGSGRGDTGPIGPEHGPPFGDAGWQMARYSDADALRRKGVGLARRNVEGGEGAGANVNGVTSEEGPRTNEFVVRTVGRPIRPRRTYAANCGKWFGRLPVVRIYSIATVDAVTALAPEPGVYNEPVGLFLGHASGRGTRSAAVQGQPPFRRRDRRHGSGTTRFSMCPMPSISTRTTSPIRR
jgi:hypothetical protein